MRDQIPITRLLVERGRTWCNAIERADSISASDALALLATHGALRRVDDRAAEATAERLSQQIGVAGAELAEVLEGIDQALRGGDAVAQYLALDDAELALWSAWELLELRLPPLEARVARDREQFFLAAGRYLPAIGWARAFGRVQRRDLFDRSHELWLTTVKHAVLTDLVEQQIDEDLQRLLARGPGRSGSPPPLPPPVAPRLAAAAPRAPGGEDGCALYRWVVQDGLRAGWRADLTVPRRPPEGEQCLIQVVLRKPNHTPAEDLDGGTLHLCGLLLQIEGAGARVELGELRRMWEYWPRADPLLHVVPPPGSDEASWTAELAEPELT